jgi:polysaccharide export outer membrane protein
MRKIFTSAVGASLAFVALAPAFAQAPAATPPSAAAPGAPATPVASEAAAGVLTAPAGISAVSASYELGVGDAVEVNLVGAGGFTTRARVGTDGAIVLPFIGVTQAKDRTTTQLAAQVRAALQAGGFFAEPMVRVEVLAAASQYATILGFVSQPGLLALDRPYRLSEVMARVGGRTDGGAPYALLTRGEAQPQRYDIAALATASGTGDPIVQAGDKIFVPALENEVFYMTGQVRTPGPQPAMAGLTLRMALARSGGVTDTGSEKKVKIVRGGQPLRNVNLDTTIVQAGDIITVGQKLF